jgi:hypothetical protein
VKDSGTLQRYKLPLVGPVKGGLKGMRLRGTIQTENVNEQYAITLGLKVELPSHCGEMLSDNGASSTQQGDGACVESHTVTGSCRYGRA